MARLLEIDHSLFYEDFQEGDSCVTQGRTITEADVYIFAGLTGDFSQIHVDKKYSESGDFGERIVPGLYAMSLAEGLKTLTGLYKTTGVASLGYNEWRFKKPIFFGDTVYVNFIVEKKRETSNKDRGILFLRVRMFNQKDEVVQEGVHVLMVRRKKKNLKD